MRPTAEVAPEDTLERAAIELRRNGGGVLPVVSNGFLLGVITDRSLALAMLDTVSHLEATEVAAVPAQTIAPYATAAEALRRFAESDGLPLVVADDMGRPMGLLSAADLYPRRRMAPRPSMVGGMATPFGVYLTNGAVSAGAGRIGLFFTGMLLSTLFLASNFASVAAFPTLARAMGEPIAGAVVSGLTLAMFLLSMRLIPLSGTHGAEHMVVHAIERGEELVPEVVRRMPRIHPRCGTNLAAASMLFLGIYESRWIDSSDVRFLVAALTTMMLWRPLGSALQQFVTTRRPSDAQLLGAVRAGQELLDRYVQSKASVPSIPQRLWNSGLLHVMSGSMLIPLVLYGLASLFGWKLAF